MRRFGVSKTSQWYLPVFVTLVGLCLVLYNLNLSESKRTLRFSESLSEKISKLMTNDDYPESYPEEDSEEIVMYANHTSIIPILTNYNFDSEQARRKSHLNKACDRNGINRSFPTISWSTTVHFITSEQFKFLFCFVPKVACTTWKDIMAEVHHYYVGDTEKVKRFYKLNELIKLQGPHEVLRRWRDFRNVIFVREPLSRVLSFYLNKFRYGQEKNQWERRFGRQISKLTRKSKGAQKDFTFEEVLRYILSLGPDIKMDQFKDHWLPYSSFTSPCQLVYTFIGHFETLGQDGPIILQRLGLKDVVQFPRMHTSTAEEILQKEYGNVPFDLILKVQQYYHMDYELFGYSKEDALESVLGYIPEIINDE